ncbi:MAG: outer membrane beta-barrel protein [Flavobacteriaceae bacterium]|nr:outer membrane beta-barrel protein [Flavobacteriaceae bacterium]
MCLIKKLSLVCALFSITIASAQFEEGDIVANFGVGVGGYYAMGSGYSTKIPPIELSGEYFVMENLSVGGFIGGSKSEYELKVPGYNDYETLSYTYFNIGLMGNYHFVNQEKFDVYAGARLGYVNLSLKYDEDEFKHGEVDALSARGSGVLAGAHVGGRYFFTNAFAANAELGYGVAILKVGISLKF